MTECLFCGIVAGSIPATIVYQDDSIVAFRDINPAAPTHILVVPRTHLPGIADARPDHVTLLGTVMLAAADVARREGIADSGYRLVINSGEDANQTVPHLHVHVLGGRALTWPPG